MSDTSCHKLAPAWYFHSLEIMQDDRKNFADSRMCVLLLYGT